MRFVFKCVFIQFKTLQVFICCIKCLMNKNDVWESFTKRCIQQTHQSSNKTIGKSKQKDFKMGATYDGSAPVQPDWAIFEGTSYKKTPPSCPNRRTFGQPLSSLSPSPSPSCGRRGNDVLHRPILPRFILPSWDQHCKTAKLICCKFFVKYFY